MLSKIGRIFFLFKNEDLASYNFKNSPKSLYTHWATRDV